MSSLAPEAASQRQDPPPPSVINVFVTLEDDGEMEWLTREGIPNLGQPGFLYEPHILVSLKGVYKSTPMSGQEDPSSQEKRDDYASRAGCLQYDKAEHTELSLARRV
jgi:hypothetical protein